MKKKFYFNLEQTFSRSEFSIILSNPKLLKKNINTLLQLKQFLDIIHIKECLLKPYYELTNYPLVEARELQPSFEADIWEYKELPGFSLVAFDRSLSYFHEFFQFDLLQPPVKNKKKNFRDPFHNKNEQEEKKYQTEKMLSTENESLNEVNQKRQERNLLILLSRLPKILQDSLKAKFSQQELSDLKHYPDLFSYLLAMDRAQVLAKHPDFGYYLAGVYASFPSDLDAEIKRFGMRIGKFHYDDEESYLQNRMFVYQFLMELYGFPIVSERRTSSALFARRLHKMGEHFFIRVLGQSDRCITTIFSDDSNMHYPKVEKIALVQVDEDQHEVLSFLKQNNLFIDEKRRAVILRVEYIQHKYNKANVRQDRALTIHNQQVIDPITGLYYECNILKDTTNLFLRLNDIVRGEYTGKVLYKRIELIENTDTEEKRLKFLYTWLSKHQRRIIGYSDDFYANVNKVLDNYLHSAENIEAFDSMRDLYLEVLTKYRYIQQARKVRFLEDLSTRTTKGEKISYLQMLNQAVNLLHELKFEITIYFDPLVVSVISLGEKILNDTYLIKKYIQIPEDQLTVYGLDIRKNYKKLIALLDEFKAIKKSRT